MKASWKKGTEELQSVQELMRRLRSSPEPGRGVGGDRLVSWPRAGEDRPQGVLALRGSLQQSVHS